MMPFLGNRDLTLANLSDEIFFRKSKPSSSTHKRIPRLAKSLVYLDLSAGEVFNYSPTAAHRAYQALNLFLDDSLKKSREEFISQKNTEFWEYRRVFQNQMFFYIMNKIFLSQDKTNELQRLLPSMRNVVRSKLLKHEYYENVNIFWHVMDYLQKLSDDSQLVVDVLVSLGSISKFVNCLHKKKGQLIDYILFHSQKAHFDLWGVLSGELLEFNQSDSYTMNEEIQEMVAILIKYGVSVENIACLIFSNSGVPRFQDRFKKEDSHTYEGKRETLQLIIVCFCYIHVLDGVKLGQIQQCISMIWESLPDAYLSNDELEKYASKIAIQELPLYSAVKEVFSWYVNEISETKGQFQPRTLKQLCRVSIRKHLAESYQLPGGIGSLGVPQTVQNYLGLYRKEVCLQFHKSRLA